MTASKIEHNAISQKPYYWAKAHMYIGRRLCGMSPVKSLTEKVVYSFTETIETNSPIFFGIELFNQRFHLLGVGKNERISMSFPQQSSPLKRESKL